MMIKRVAILAALLFGLAAPASAQIDNPSGSTFWDHLFTVRDNSDSSKRLRFQLSGFTTATTRTLTPPNTDGTIAVLGLAQTFTAAQSVPDDAYAAGWDGSVQLPTKNALYDKIQLVSAAAGDVFGPASATANSIPRFSGTTGKIIKGYTSGTPTVSDTGSVTIPTLTAGSVLFAGTGGLLNQDNSSIFWDDTNNRLGILTTAPQVSLQVEGGITASGQGYGFNGLSAMTQGFAPSGTTVFMRGSTIYLQSTSGGETFMTLAAGGKVGISGTSPTARLHIDAGTATANTAPIKLTSGTLNTVAVAGQHEYNGNHRFTNVGLLRYPIGGPLFDFFTDTSIGGAEADIYSATLLANTFNGNGDKITASYGGNFVTVGTELTQLKVYLAGTAIWDSTALAPTTGTNSWAVEAKLIRVSSTVVRYTVTLIATGGAAFVSTSVGELTGLTLSGTNILKLTGTSSGTGSGVGDVIGRMGSVRFEPAS